MQGYRSSLTLDDLASIAGVSASAPEPDAIFRTVECLAQRTIGHRLFTVMRLHAASGEVERLYSSRPEAYPVSGRKPKQGTTWGEQVLDRGEIFIARNRNEVRGAFADFELIFRLGIGAIMNVPIRFRGRSLGTLNLCHEAGWFQACDAPTGRLLAGCLVPVLLATG